MTKPYFLPLMDAVLTGLNRSIWSSSNDLEEETTFFDLKKGFENFPFWHALHRASELYFRLGSPLTKFN